MFEHKCHFLYQFSKVSCRGPDRGKLLFSLSMTLCSESLTKSIGTCCVLVCSKVFCHEGWGRYTQLQVSLLLNDFSSKKKKAFSKQAEGEQEELDKVKLHNKCSETVDMFLFNHVIKSCTVTWKLAEDHRSWRSNGCFLPRTHFRG